MSVRAALRPALGALTASAILLAVAAPGLAAPAVRAAVTNPAPATAKDANPRPNDAPLATVFPDPTNPTGCDTTQPDAHTGGSDGWSCMTPWPNDLFTTGTGAARRLNLPLAGMPKDAAGKPINPLPYNVSDGFSPGQMMVIRVPGLDNLEAYAQTGAVPITDMGAYLSPTAPVVVVDVQTGKRHPIWTEIDTNPLGPLPAPDAIGDTAGTPTGPERPTNTANVNFIIRPAKNFINGHRYVVGMRHLKNAAGDVLPAPLGFSILRDESLIPATAPAPVKALETRRAHFEQDVFPVLTEAGFARGDLYQAWDFTVASPMSIASRLLHMRDDAFAQLGDTTMADRIVQGSAPVFTVDEPENSTDAKVGRTITGTFTVPCYVNTPNCAPGGNMVFNPTDLDQRKPLQVPGNVSKPTFTCRVPQRALDPAKPFELLRPSLYGHGLFGSQGEVGSGPQSDAVSEHGFMYCATDWEGMATVDVATAAQALADMDRFPAFADKIQQGILNFMYLSRLMIHPQGFSSNPAFQVDKGDGMKSFIDTTRAFYDGNSQGGIYGGTYMAVTPDADHGVLGVPGINYSTLLRRSSDFALYAIPLYTTYPSELERPLLLSLIQILWDRSDPNGYVNQTTDQPLPNTHPHKVMYQVAFGDHQVANVTADSAARSAGAAVDPQPLEEGRSPDVEPVWGAPRIPSYPYDGSAIVYFDTGAYSATNTRGTPPAPITDTPPNEGADPHSATRTSPCGRVMKSNFLRVGGLVTNPCLGAPYYGFDYKGTPATGGQGWKVQAGDASPVEPAPVVPEAPWTVLLVVVGAAVGGAALHRRKTQAA